MTIATSNHDFLAGIWFFLESLFLVFYVVLDGFDLGVGILTLFGREHANRMVMMNSLGTIWDANESWLVVLGGTLFGAFPLVYALVLRALYLPAIAMLFGFVFRGVAFEYRELAHDKARWLWSFGLGSLLVALSQGYILGGILQGMPVHHGHFTGGLFDWFGGFSTLVMLGVVTGYVVIGATYLIIKSESHVAETFYPFARYGARLLLLLAVAITIMTAVRFDWAARSWFRWPAIVGYAALPAIALAAFWRLFRALRAHRTLSPFVWTLVIFVSSFLGLGITIYPYAIPDTVTVYQGASGSSTLIFMLAVVGFFIPIMIVYNSYLYFAFRGKTSKAGYEA